MPSPRARLLFVPDAAPAAGLGHIVRSTALAAALGPLEIGALFLVPRRPALVARLKGIECDAALDAQAWPDPADAAGLVQIARRNGCQGVVVDSYRVSVDVLDALRAAGLFVAVIDDLARWPFSCHLVINGGAQARGLGYRASAPDTQFLLGTDYILLRAEFQARIPRRPAAVIEHVLVTLGGGASTELVDDILGQLDLVPDAFAVTVIRGPLMADAARSEAASPSRRTVRVLVDPPAVHSLMRDADLAVCGGGQTLYELAAVGTPAVALQLADNQAESLRAVVASGAACLADGTTGRAGGGSVTTVVQTLCAQPDRRAAMSAAGQRLVDGAGAARVARVLAERFARAVEQPASMSPQ